MSPQSLRPSVATVLARPAMRTSLIVLSTAILTFCLFYFTPLRYVNIVEPTIHDIDPAEFYKLLQEHPDDYIFIDVRGKDAYDRLHATGSILMPLHTLYNERHNLPKHGKTIVLICSGGIASGVGYSYLEHYGFRNIRRIHGGIEMWQAARLPVEGSAVEQVE